MTFLNELNSEVLLKAIQNQKDGIEELFSGKRQSISLNLHEAKDMTFAGNFPTANASVATIQPGVSPLVNPMSHVRELLRQGSMTGSTYNFIKETSFKDQPFARPAAEGVEKHSDEINMSEVSSPAQWIAGYLVCSRNMMDDIVAFASYLESRLTELLLVAEDNQLINGNGTSPNISGITDSGNFTTSASGALSVNSIIADMGQLAALKRNVNGVLVNDQDYYTLMTSATNAAISFSNGQLYIAGVPIYKNLQLGKGSSIVGDWVNGASLIVRDPARVEFFYEDSDNVRKNNVTVRVEERIAFPVYSATHFVYKAG